MGKVSLGPRHLLSRCALDMWDCALWRDVRHTLILTTSASDPGPGKFYTNEKMLRIFLQCRCRPVSSATSPVLPSVISIMGEFFAHYFYPVWVATMQGGFSSLNVQSAQSASLNLLGVAGIISRNIDIKMAMTFVWSSSSHQLVIPYKEFMWRY